MYVTNQDLYNFIGGFDSSNNKITTDALNDIRKKVCNEIDSKLKGVYEIPVNENTSPKAFSILKFIGIDLAREYVALKLDTPIFDSETKQESPYIKSVKKANMRLDEIENGTYDLIDAVRCPSCTAFSSGNYDTTKVEGKPKDSYFDHDRYYYGNF